MTVLLWLGAALAGSDPLTVTADKVSVTPARLSAEGNVRLQNGSGELSADEVVYSVETEDLYAKGVLWTPCTCLPAPWAIEAEHVEGRLDDALVATGVWLRVCERRLIPLPGGELIVSGRSVRPLVPTLGYGRQGAHVGLPTWFPVGDSGSLEVSPEVYSRGPVGARGHIEGGLGDASARVGVSDATVRGTAQAQLAQHTGTSRWGFDGSWYSDESYAEDFGGTYFDRHPIDAGRRGFVAVGPVRVEHFSPAFAEGGRPAAAVVSFPSEIVLGGALNASMRIDRVAGGDDGITRLSGAAAYSKGWRSGPVEVSSRVLVEESQDSSGMRARGMGGTLRAGLAHWGEVYGGRIVALSGVEYQQQRVLRGVHLSHFGGIGPFHEARLVTTSGVPLRFAVASPWTEEGWMPVLDLEIQQNGWTVAGTGHRDTQFGRFGRTGEDGDVHLGVLREDAFHAAYGAVGVAVGAQWRVGWTGSADVGAFEVVHHGPDVRWEPPCGCISASASVEWARDVSVPAAFMRVDLRQDG